MSEVTRILNRIESGQADAAADLFTAVYAELRRMAAARMRAEKPGQTIGPTALVHEAWLRLAGQRQCWDSRAHFFGAAAEAMRRILVDRVRRKQAHKRGGERKRVDLDVGEISADDVDDRLLVLDAALAELEAGDPQKAELVKLRYFAGCTIEQAAELQGISTATANRQWAYARAWLQSRMSSGEADPTTDP